MIDVSQRYGVGNVDAAFVFLLEDDVWRFFVDSDAKTFQLILDDPLVRQGLVDVKYDEYQMTRLGDGYDLSPTTFAVLCSLNDTWQI